MNLIFTTRAVQQQRKTIKLETSVPENNKSGNFSSVQFQA